VGNYNLFDGPEDLNVLLDKPDGTLRILLTQPGREIGHYSSKMAAPNVGCISFMAAELIQGIRMNSHLSKIWITLFESAEDDLYDGDFSEDDSERPRIRVNYKLSTSTSESQLKKPTASSKTIRQTKQTRQ
jgi:hypothetical protein